MSRLPCAVVAVRPDSGPELGVGRRKQRVSDLLASLRAEVGVYRYGLGRVGLGGSNGRVRVGLRLGQLVVVRGARLITHVGGG